MMIGPPVIDVTTKNRTGHVEVFLQSEDLWYHQ